MYCSICNKPATNRYVLDKKWHSICPKNQREIAYCNEHVITDKIMKDLGWKKYEVI
jgi:hypothetical protein